MLSNIREVKKSSNCCVSGFLFALKVKGNFKLRDFYFSWLLETVACFFIIHLAETFIKFPFHYTKPNNDAATEKQSKHHYYEFLTQCN